MNDVKIFLRGVSFTGEKTRACPKVGNDCQAVSLSSPPLVVTAVSYAQEPIEHQPQSLRGYKVSSQWQYNTHQSLVSATAHDTPEVLALVPTLDL